MSKAIGPDDIIHQGPIHLVQGAANTPSSNVSVLVKIGRSGHVHLEVWGEGKKTKVAAFEVYMDTVRPKA